MEDRIGYFERVLARNPNNPTGFLALANEYQKAGRHRDEAATLERYLSVHEDERTGKQHAPCIRFRASLTEKGIESVEVASA